MEFRTHTRTREGVREGEGSGSESWLAGPSRAVERLRARALAAARTGSAVTLIHGEPGTGKLRVAQLIHRCGNRSVRPMLVLDADDENLNSQLDRVIAALSGGLGSREVAPGTVALRNAERAGDGATQRMLEILGSQGVELTCALFLITKRSPEQLRGVSPAHSQLLGRVGGAEVTVPAIRHRSGDVAELARIFVEEAALRYDKPIRGISSQALSKLQDHSFPGNVRELQAMVEQAVLRTTGDWVTVECFPGLGDEASVRTTDDAELIIRLPGSSLREIEIQALRLALKLSEGRIVRASELLGITRHALRRKLDKFDLNDLRA